jgi:hypothetical protein
MIWKIWEKGKVKNLPFFHIFPIVSFGGGGGGGGGYRLTIYILFDRYPYLVVLHLLQK